MAYRRSLTTSARLLARQRLATSFAHTHHEDDRKVKMSFLQSRSFGNNTNTYFSHTRHEGDRKVKMSNPQSRNNTNTWLGFGGGGTSIRDPKRSQFLHVTSGFLFARNMSTVNGDADGGEKIGFLADLMEVVSNHASPGVAAAAADSCLPVAALQHAIDGIHIYTGLNWWASIAITTLVIRTLSIPLLIRNSKALVLTFIEREIRTCGDHLPIDSVYKEHRVTRLTPLKGLFIKGTVLLGFYHAIENMVEKVPSFQTGGINWFIDLTTTDSYYILPCLAAYSFWYHQMPELVEVNPNPFRGKKYAVLLLFAGSFSVAATFSNAFLCYWITSNVFYNQYERIIEKPLKNKLLNIPIIHSQIALRGLEKGCSCKKQNQQSPTKV